MARGDPKMIFRVAAGLFRPGAARTADLITLLRNAAIRDHTLWVVEDPEGASDAEPQVFHEWTLSLVPPLQREVRWLRESLRRLGPHAVTRGAVVITVDSSHPSASSTGAEDSGPDRVSAPPDAATATRTSRVGLDLASAIRLASMPLFLLVENGLSEAAFLRRVMPPRWRHKLTEWERNGRLRFEHGGGAGEMRRIVLHFAEGQSPDPLGLGAAPWRAAHFLICDSDTKSMVRSARVRRS